MRKAPIYILIAALVMVLGALYVKSVAVGSKSTHMEGYADERPSFFSLNVGSRPQGGLFKALKAGLSLFGLVPKDESTEVLKELMEEYHNQLAESDEEPDEDEAEEKAADAGDEESEDEAQGKLARPLLELDEVGARAGRGNEQTNYQMDGSFLGEGGSSASAPPVSAMPHQSYMDDRLPDDVEGWLERIKFERNYRAFTQFVALFQVGHLGPEIFYPVVRALLEDSDTLLVKYGVLALTGAPETESFATLLESRNVVVQDTEILQLLAQGVSAYAEPTQLPYLFILLRNPERSEDFHRAVELAEISLNNWYTPESAHAGGVYYQLQLTLNEGLQRAGAADLQAELQRLLDLMNGLSPHDELLLGGAVSY